MKSIEEIKAMSNDEIKKLVSSIDRWLKAVVRAILMPLAKNFLGSARKGIRNIVLSIGNDSYTDNRDVLVTITPEEAVKFSKKEIMAITKFKLYHELSHVLYTDNTEYEEGALIIANKANELAEQQGLCFIKNDLRALCLRQMNIIEDGRIENIFCNKFPGLKINRDFYRLLEWKEYTISEEEEGKAIIHNTLLFISTMGMLPQGFTEAFPPSSEMYELAMKLAEPIAEYVVSNTIKAGFPFVEELAELIAPYLVRDYALTKEEYEEYMKNNNSQNTKYSREEMEALARQIEEELKNQRNFPQSFPGMDGPQNGPLVSILTDEEDEENTEGGDGKTPDLIIDLRKEAKKRKKEREENKDEKKPYYHRPDDLDPLKTDEEEGDGGDSTEEGDDTDGGDSTNKGGNTDKGDDTDEGDNTNGGNDTDKGDDTDEGGNTDKGGNTNKGNSTDGGNKGKRNDFPDVAPIPMKPLDNTNKGDKGNKGKNDVEKGKEDIKDNGNATHPYQLPSPQDFLDALDEVSDKLSEVLQRDVVRANADETSWEQSKDNALPLEQSSITSLISEFGGYPVNVVDDYRRAESPQVCPSDIKRKGVSLANKISAIINAKSSPSRKDCRYGIVDTQNLGKFISGQTDFYKHNAVNKPVDIACLILKDDSGSMSGRNENVALETLAELEECFKKLKNSIKFRMQAFSTARGETMKVIKDFNDNDTSKSYSWTFHSHSCPSGGNNDAYSIALASDLLAKRSEKNKLLIIVSDGAPCCSPELVTKAVARARAQGIFVISILIGSEYEVKANWELFTSMYNQNLISGSLDKLGDQMFKFIKKFVASV